MDVQQQSTRQQIQRTLGAVAIALLLLTPWLAAQESRTFVFAHVNVVPMNREIVLEDQNVVVTDGTIRAIGAASTLSIPAAATVIDGTGRFLLPGLSDMHVHLEGEPWNIMYPPGKGLTKDKFKFDDILFMYIANGITTIDVMFAFPEHLVLREQVRRHEMLGPRLILSRMIDGAGKGWPPPLGVWINNPAEASMAVRDAHAQGYDRIKVYSFLDAAEYDTIIATARELRMPVDGHIPFATSVEHALESGQGMIAHVEEIMKFAKAYTPEEVAESADRVARSEIWVTSTLILNHNLNLLLKDSAGQFTKPGTEFLTPMASQIWSYVYQHVYNPIPASGKSQLVDSYENFQRPFVGEFVRRGGKLLTGTDALVPSTLPAISLHEELALLVDAGLRPFEALKASTTNPFEFLGESSTAGTVEPGKVANLVLLQGNPLTDISQTRRIVGVMTQGRWITRAGIDGRLAAIATSNGASRGNDSP